MSSRKERGCLGSAIDGMAGTAIGALGVGACVLSMAGLGAEHFGSLSHTTKGRLLSIDFNSSDSLIADFGPEGKVEFLYDIDWETGDKVLVGVSIIASTDPNVDTERKSGVLVLALKPSK